MHRTAHIFIVLLLGGILPVAAMPVDTPLHARTLTQLEHRLEEIDSGLAELAHFSLRNGMGSIGYRSDAHTTPAHTEWVQIELGQDTPINQVVLVPVISRDAQTGYRADGFPVEFRVIGGASGNTNGTVIATFDKESGVLPRIAPLIIPCVATASWVRVEADLLSPRSFDGKYNLELAEIMVFNSRENMALHKPVQTSFKREPTGLARRKEFLVDGYLPYLMHAGRGEQSIAFIGEVEPETSASLSIDLGTTYPLNRIHLHSIELTDTVPQSHPTDFGIPRHMIIEGANKPDFSDTSLLVDYRFTSIFESGPIIMQNCPETPCRYIRATVVEPYIYNQDKNGLATAGFAEIELFSNGRNVALNKKVEVNFKRGRLNRPYQALTDGRNIYGKILSIRQWMEELARRHDLETEHPLVAAELARRYARQKANLRRMGWLAALLAAGIGFTILIDRLLRMRQVTRIKERFAADLHDELGANVHAIGMLNEIAKEADSAEEQDMLGNRISALTERTGSAIRHFTNMLEADNLYIGLVEDMQRSAERIATNIEHDFSTQGEAFVNLLKPRTRADLFLFYKESLVNICRHSGATKLSTHLTANTRELRLTISDNGIGMEDCANDGIPSSLKRRARLLGAHVATECSPLGGTMITLVLRIRHPKFIRKKP